MATINENEEFCVVCGFYDWFRFLDYCKKHNIKRYSYVCDNQGTITTYFKKRID